MSYQLNCKRIHWGKCYQKNQATNTHHRI
ncbi:TPA: hypothetical protein F8A23_08925 [Legionella pneumophila]|nr:hypothetical protein [Legionella pneumophila]HAT8859007.1 hypothetical protein [Legionella pneumophila subsp. pneumophila]HAT8889230.1 hypothetical protein [Legionella pneumophila subsp. pneumophila]HAT9650740.1 hypothetical protein [Legionella pneumophila subsp. pneumophila]HAT9919807.1 hypothetical protein [Legionella pneumophila subsp. pneumophila]